MLTAVPTYAGDAVSHTNAKLQAIGGNVDGNDAHALMGSLTFPAGSRFGVQLDALAGEINDENARGYGLHGFWRDADKGLVGVTASRVKLGNNTMKRAGIEGEYYFPQLTLAGALGKQSGDVPDDTYGNLGFTWYPQDNLAVSLNASKADNSDRQTLGLEYQTPVKGLSLFADAAHGNDDYEHLIGGLTYYFGSDKTLKQRHRQDDPRNPLLEQAVSTYQQCERVIPCVGDTCGDPIHYKQTTTQTNSCQTTDNGNGDFQ